MTQENTTSFQQLLDTLSACADAREWAGDMTIEEVVATCRRGDWLLWLAAKVGVEERLMVLAGGLCANTVRHLMQDERSVKAVDVCIAYGEGKATWAERAAEWAAVRAARAARSAAWAARAARSAAWAALAARSAAWAAEAAAEAAVGAVRAARSAAWATEAAAWVAAEAAEGAARAERAAANQHKTADIVREVMGQRIVELVNKRIR